MPRGKRKPVEQQANAFLEALKFCALVTKDHGTPNETHVHIENGWISAFNGTLGIGHHTNNDLHACPQIKLLIEALSKCGQNIAITQLDNNRLSIKSERFKAIVPCLATDLLSATIPDPPIAVIDDRLKDAFAICGLLNTDGGQTIYAVSVLLNGQSLIASLSGSMIIEYWHGIDLPSGLAIPKALIVPLSKINKKLARFGFSNSSVTFYFEDQSWIRSQLYAEQWPEIRHIFNCTSNVQQFPADFYKALAAVSPFGEGMVFFRDGRLSSHAQEGTGADYEMPSLVGSWCYPAKQLAALQWATHVDFQAQGEHGPMLYAVGKQARAIIAGIRQEPIREVKDWRSIPNDEIPY